MSSTCFNETAGHSDRQAEQADTVLFAPSSIPNGSHTLNTHSSSTRLHWQLVLRALDMVAGVAALFNQYPVHVTAYTMPQRFKHNFPFSLNSPRFVPAIHLCSANSLVCVFVHQFNKRTLKSCILPMDQSERQKPFVSQCLLCVSLVARQLCRSIIQLSPGLCCMRDIIEWRGWTLAGVEQSWAASS